MKHANYDNAQILEGARNRNSGRDNACQMSKISNVSQFKTCKLSLHFRIVKSLTFSVPKTLSSPMPINNQIAENTLQMFTAKLHVDLGSTGLAAETDFLKLLYH